MPCAKVVAAIRSWGQWGGKCGGRWSNMGSVWILRKRNMVLMGICTMYLLISQSASSFHSSLFCPKLNGEDHSEQGRCFSRLVPFFLMVPHILSTLENSMCVTNAIFFFLLVGEVLKTQPSSNQKHWEYCVSVGWDAKLPVWIGGRRVVLLKKSQASQALIQD